MRKRTSQTELHPSLVAGWNKYIKADQELRAFVEKYNDERQNAELNEAQKKYGKKLHYYHLKLPMDGKGLIAAVDALRENSADTANASKLLAGFAQTLSETQALVAEEKKGKNSNPLYEGGYEQFVKYASWYKEAVDAWRSQARYRVVQPVHRPGEQDHVLEDHEVRTLRRRSRSVWCLPVTASRLVRA